MLKIDWKLAKLIAETVLIWIGVIILFCVPLAVGGALGFILWHFVDKYW